MKTTPKRTARACFLIAAVLCLLAHGNANAATYTSIRSGAWSDASTWGTTSTPGINDLVIIRYLTTVTIPDGCSAACASLTVGSARSGLQWASLSFGGPGATLTVGGTLFIGAVMGTAITTGSVDMTAGGTLSAAGITVNALPTSNGWLPGSGKVVLTGANTLPSQLGSFHSLTLDAATTASTSITLTGNWTNNATYSPGTHTVTFLGTAGQVLSGSANTGFHNLTINKSGANVTMQRAVSLTGNLAFASYTQGCIVLGNNDLSLSASSSLNGYTASAFIVTDGNGMLIRAGVGNTPVVFPVGPSASSCNPVTIVNAGTLDAFSVRVQEGFDNMPNLPNAVVNRQWTITESNSGGSDVTLSMKWCSSEEGSGFSRTSPLCVGRWAGSFWVPASASYCDNYDGTYTATASGLDTFSQFGVGNTGALPVELTSFSARLKGADAMLKWTTATETNNFGFDVERSADRERWQRVGFVPGHGNSASPKDYAFTDEGAALVAPLLYYRLKQIDRDGTTENSAVAEVRAGATGFELAQNYPNPFAGATTLNYSLQQDEHVTLRLYSLLGNKIAVLAEGLRSAGSHALALDPGSLGLQPGRYLCVLRAGGHIQTQTLVYMP